MDQPLIVLDLETTGISAYRHRVTEIAAVKLVNGEIVDEFHSMVNPGYPIPRFITRLTGINDEMVADAPPIKDVLPQLKEFLGDDVIVAHNAGFDMRFLTYNFLMHHDHKLENPALCTYRLANRLLDIPRRRLGDCCEHFEVVNEQAHRAMGDVIATTKILSNMMEILMQSNISTVEKVLEFSHMPKARATKLLLD